MNDLRFRDKSRPPAARTGFRLDKVNGKIGGVCAGLGRHFGLDVTMLRVVFVLGTLIGFGSFLLVYLAIWLLAD